MNKRIRMTDDGEEAIGQLRLEDLPFEFQLALITWIGFGLVKTKTFNSSSTSYGLKHAFHRDTGIYVTNDIFKEAMLKCGFCPKDESDENWIFCVGNSSPALYRMKNGDAEHFIKNMLREKIDSYWKEDAKNE